MIELSFDSYGNDKGIITFNTNNSTIGPNIFLQQLSDLYRTGWVHPNKQKVLWF